mgnify:CR=1 FL=1
MCSERMELCAVFTSMASQHRSERTRPSGSKKYKPSLTGSADLRPQVGSTVTITDGPERLRGLTGEVLEHRGRTYVLLRVKAVRQAVKVEVNAKWVEETEDTAQRA